MSVGCLVQVSPHMATQHDARHAICVAVFKKTKQLLAPCRMVMDNNSLVEQLLHNNGVTVSHPGGEPMCDL